MSLLLFTRSNAVMSQELKLRLQSTAAVAALPFSVDDIEQVWTMADMQKPVFRSLVLQLQQIREVIPHIRYVYIMRRTSDPMVLSFVADADALSSVEDLDENENGVIDPDEQVSYPGDTYPIDDIAALRHDAFLFPTSDEEITYDQWGALISGYAPIRDSRGETVAILGIDMEAGEYLRQARRIFSPYIILLITLIGVLLAVYILLFLRDRRISMLQKLNQERSAMMDLASHQLGTPLSIFKWWVEIMKENQGKVTDTQEVCTQMEKGIERMESIMDAMRKVNNMHKKSHVSTSGETSLDRAVREVQDHLQFQLQKNKQTLKHSLGKGIMVKMEKELLTGVLDEVLMNALSYSPEGETIFIRAKAQRKFVQIEVEDRGCGIPEDDIDHVFEEFRRGSNAAKCQPVGNGIGLFVAKGIIETVGGKIWLKTQEGKGTTVFIKLPTE